MTIGDLVLVNAFMIQIYIPLNFLGVLYREVKQALTDMERMFALTAEHTEVADAPGAPALVVGDGEVRFEHVDFGYEKNRQILFDVSFTIPAGKTVAVVGPSGAGKSTLSRLLFRFYDVTGGRITVNGQDIRAVRQDSLRAAIGIVPQDTVLFNDSIEYNIAYGRPGATHDEIVAAAQARADPRFHREHARGLRDAGRRARPEALGRRKAARGDRARGAQGAADPDLRRGDLRARLEIGKGDPGRVAADRHEPDDADDRPPAVDDRRCRRDPGPRPRPDRRARDAWRASCARRACTRGCGSCSRRNRPAESSGGDAEIRQLSTPLAALIRIPASPLVESPEAITPAVS